MKYVLAFGTILFFIFLTSCNSLSNSTNTQPQVTMASSLEISTQTATPRPTSTPNPTRTHTPMPTPIFTPWPTKEVLLQFGVFGGDGGWETYTFIGRDTPKLILYTDGQLIVKKEDENGVWFEETMLTTPQMCSLLVQIENSGFFNLEVDNSSEAGIPTANPIYKFDDSTQFSEGGPNYIMQVNGPHPRQIHIYYQYVEYLSPEARRVFNFFNNYSPPSTLNDYHVQYLLLRIEEGLGYSVYETPAPTIQTWPADLPSLEMLEKDKVETELSAYLPQNSRDKISQVLVKSELVEPIFEAFGSRLAYTLFQSEDSVYYVAARPFLPHETLNSFSSFPWENEFALPFSCID